MGIEEEMYQLLQESWKYVNTPFTSNSAKAEVGKYVTNPFSVENKVGMLFALQTAWTFVHGSGDEKLMQRFRDVREKYHDNTP